MYPMPTRCPVCQGGLTVARLRCDACDTTIDGHFAPAAMAELSPEHLAFVVTFLRCEGKFTRMQGELGLSYPTLRSRLHDVIRALGYDPSGEEQERVETAETERREVLAALDQGRIDAEEALRLLQGEER